MTVAGMLSLALSSVAPIPPDGSRYQCRSRARLGVHDDDGARIAGAVLAEAATGTNARWVAGKYGARLLPLLRGRWRWAWLALAGVLVLPVAGLNRLRIDTDYTRFFSPDTPVSRAYRELAASGFPQSVVEIVITAQAGGSLDRGHIVRGLSELESRAAKLPRVRNTLSEQQILQGADEALNGPGGVPAMDRLSRGGCGAVADGSAERGGNGAR